MSALPLSNKHIVSGFPANHFRTFKDVSFRVLTVAAIMYASLYGLRQLFARPYSFNMFGLKNCHSMNANFSTMAKLPTHYALPSGDKIPTVGLGAYQRICPDSLLTVMFRCMEVCPKGCWRGSEGLFDVPLVNLFSRLKLNRLP